MSGAGPASEPGAERRCGFVAVIGAPNAGKSTLVNRLVGAKVSIVTQKVQTTRAQIRGIAMIGASQIVLVDTPGIFEPRRRLDRAMVAAAWASVDEADSVLLVVDAAACAAAQDGTGDAAARRAAEDVERIVTRMQADGRQAILALNKIDRLKRDRLLALVKEFDDRGVFSDIFLISAATGDGVEDLGRFLAAQMPPGPWHFAEDQLADISERLMAAEITREKLFLRLHEELPYSATVETEGWKRTRRGELRIEQTIYVSRPGHKAIVLGKGGRTIKEIGKAARAEIEEFLGEKAHLFLFVKLRENWQDDPERYRQMGLDFHGGGGG